MKCMNNLRAATMMRTAVVKDVAGILSDASARVRQDHAAVLGQRVQQGRLVQPVQAGQRAQQDRPVQAGQPAQQDLPVRAE